MKSKCAFIFVRINIQNSLSTVWQRLAGMHRKDQYQQLHSSSKISPRSLVGF